ncbi:MAG: alpha/beta hydrolase [Candidatus Delongbacteria bacterium]|jgi:acetyl esterase/lipase|nr:alpha/beta hydrolase [Candidatus Delongbacteria bacterium]
MKHLILLIAILISFQMGYSQNEILVKGKINNYGSRIIQIGDYKAKIDSLGNFELKFKTSEPDIYTLMYHGEETDLFLEPKNVLEIEFNAQDFYNTISFSGSNKNIQSFLVDLTVRTKPVTDYFKNQWNELTALSEKEYIEKINELKFQVINPIDEFVRNNQRKENPWFAKYYKLNTELNFNRLIYMYPVIHYDYVSLEDQLKFRERYSYIESFDYNDAKLLKNKNYIRLMSSILRLEVIDQLINNPQLGKSDNQWITAYQSAIIKMFSNDTVRNYWLHRYIYDHIDNFGVKNIAYLIEEFNNVCTDSSYKQEINDYYQKEFSKRQNYLTRTYKQIDGFDLDAHIFKPKDLKSKEKRGAILYFHGGGFSSGKPDWHCHYDSNGFVQISFEYRIYDRHGTMPFAAIEDAKSAIRWVRENAEELQIDTNRIIAAGNSCGAAMVIATGLLDSLDNPSENLNISSKPTVMLLYASGYDQTNKFGPVKDKSRLARISGINIVKSNAPPCLVIHGSRDYGIPISEAKEFVDKMLLAGNLCEFKVLEGAGHVPWLKKPHSTEAYTARQDFLRKIGYIE